MRPSGGRRRLYRGALPENWPTRDLLDLTVGYAIGQREDRFRDRGHATVEGLTDDLCRLDDDVPGLAVSCCMRRSRSSWAARAVARPDRAG